MNNGASNWHASSRTCHIRCTHSLMRSVGRLSEPDVWNKPPARYRKLPKTCLEGRAPEANRQTSHSDPTRWSAKLWYRQHVHASLFRNTETGTEARPIVGSTPADKMLQECRRLVRRFDPASAQANINLMSRILPGRGRLLPVRMSHLRGERPEGRAVFQGKQSRW